MDNYDKIVQAYMDDDIAWTLDDMDLQSHPLLDYACYALGIATKKNKLTVYKDMMSRSIKTMEAMRDAVEVE